MKLKKLLCIAIAFILTVTVLAGCGNKISPTSFKVEPGTDGKITRDPLELTLHMRVFTDAFNYDKQTMFQEAFKYTNIKCKGTSSDAASDANQEFNIMLASSPLPDIIHGSKSNINKSAVDGALIPLDDLVNQYAPNIKAYLDANPAIRKGSVASDGKLYFIPNVRQGTPSIGFFIRMDWLKKLKLQVPKTVNEYHDVLKAFKDDDPNENGQQDEVPYFQRGKGIDDIVQLWGARANWYIDKNQNYINGKMQPEYKTAMINLAQWYKEGLIDKEIFSRGQNARDTLLGNNTGGSTHDWFSSTGSYNDTLKDKVSGFDLAVMPPPADINGVAKEEVGRSPLTNLGWGISKDNKYVVETVKYLDWWYSEQGLRTFNYGVEGVDYNMVDGNPVYTNTVLKAQGGAPTYLRNKGQNELGSVSFIDGELQAMSASARNGYKMYSDNNYVLPQLPSLSFTPDERHVIDEKDVSIKTYMSEVQQKWLFGNESVEDGWDDYIAQVKSMGYDDVQKAYQNAYNRYLGQ